MIIIANLIKIKTRIFSEFSSNVGMSVDRLLVSTAIKPLAEFITFTAISAIMKVVQRTGLATFSSSSNFEIRMRDRVKVNLANTSLTITNFQVIATANQYYLVSDWDASLLSTLDTMLLSELDSQIA